MSQVALKTETSLANLYERYGQAAANRTIVGSLLRFNKFGEYKFGPYEEALAAGTKLAAYMGSFCTGWTRWEASKPVEVLMGPIGAGFTPPPRDTLGHTDRGKWETFDDGRPKDPWTFTNTLVLIDRGRKTGDEYFTFSTSSRGGLGALAELSLAYGNHLRQKPGEYPIVELGVGSYQHSNRSYGEIRFPVFRVVDWIPAKDLPPLEGDNLAQIATNTDRSQGF